MAERTLVSRWGPPLAALLLGIAVGSALDLTGEAGRESATGTRGDIAAAPAPAARPDGRAARAEQAEAASVAALTNERDEARAACARAERERDEARAEAARASARPPTLLDLIDAASEEAAVKFEDKVRDKLVEARRNDIEFHWARVIGPGLPQAEGGAGTDVLELSTQTRFKRFYAELRRPRTPEEVRRLYDTFAEPYRTRLHPLRERIQEAARGRANKGAADEASSDLRAELWREGEAVLALLDPLLDADEQNELRVRGSDALGIPPPADRLVLGWTRLLGDGVPAPDPSAIRSRALGTTDGAFAHVYVQLQRERTRDELRALHARIQAACEAEGHEPWSELEAVKGLLDPGEWRRMRYFTEHGVLPLSR
jgi:hypothetical protein